MLGKRIRAAREARSIGQAALARLIGVEPVTMWRYEAGRLRPGLASLEKIASTLSVTLDSLLYGKRRPGLKRGAADRVGGPGTSPRE
jgi:transcriptional regulator with XRE-family HTH domain